MIRVCINIILFLICFSCYGQDEVDSLNTIEQIIQADSILNEPLEEVITVDSSINNVLEEVRGEVKTDGSLRYFSLQEAKDYAVKNNINVKMKKTDSAMAKEQMREIRATGLPQVNANMNYNRFFQLPTSLIPADAFPPNPEEPDAEFVELQFGTKNTVGFSLDANQLIFSGSYLTALEAAKEFASLRSEEITQSEEQVKFAVSQAYYNVLLAKAQIKILEKNKSNLEQILFETTQLYENGFIELLDVDRLNLSLSNINIQIATTKRSLYVAKEFLKFQMGYTEDTDIELSEGLDEILPQVENVVVDEVDDFNPRKRIEYRLLDRQKLLTELDIKNVKWQGYPSLAAFASYQQNWQQDKMKEIFNTDFWFPTFLVGLQLNVPIFSGFRGDANIEQKKLQIVQINQAQSLMKQSFNLEHNQTRIEYLSSLEQLRSQRENIALAEKIYNTSLIKYKEGLGSSLEVNAAESELFQTQGLYLQALYNLLIAKTNLDKANGVF